MMYGPGEPVTLNELDKHGRTIMIRYKCRRCGVERIETLKEALDREDWNYFGDITRFNLQNWQDSPFLCGVCSKEYIAFLNNELPKER